MLALALNTGLKAQGINFSEGDFSEALGLAKEQNKLIFIDMYTSWCGPCKQMAANIFTQQAAGDYYNEHFINFKADAEKSEDGRMLAKKFEVTAFPTFLFVDGEGELVYRFLGYRDIEPFLEEGKNALDAYELKPMLKAYEIRFNNGERDKAFLDEYSEFMGKAGLDYSHVLTAYLSDVPDAELLAEENLKRIENVKVYDAVLTDRLMASLLALSEAPAKEDKLYSKQNRAVAVYLGGALNHVAKLNMEPEFEKLLAAKDRFMEIEGNRNSVSLAMMSGGMAYLPTPILRLDFYSGKNREDQFIRTFDQYTADVKPELDEIKKQIRSLKEGYQVKMDQALAAGDEKEYKSLKGTAGMVTFLVEIDVVFISSSLLEYIDTYDRFYKGEKNAAYYDKLAGWYTYFHSVNPSVKVALYAADKLVEMDRKADAAAVLELALDQGREASEVTEEMIAQCEEKLKELKN